METTCTITSLKFKPAVETRVVLKSLTSEWPGALSNTIDLQQRFVQRLFQGAATSSVDALFLTLLPFGCGEH